MAPAGTLPALMEVLRRPQQPGDAPASVVRAARDAAATAQAPYAGRIDPAGVRRLAEAVGHRLYLAPPEGGEAALAILTDGSDRPVQRPYGLTPRLLRSGAFYVLYGVRAVGDEPKDLRMLQLQLVPDRITRIDYRFPAVPAPEAVCRGVGLPRDPRRHPRGTGRLDVGGLCRQLGLPQQAYRHDVGVLVLRYGDRVYTTSDGRVHGIAGRLPGDPFPPPLARAVPSTAVKLAR